MATYETETWLRATKTHHCPVCDRDHFCTMAPDNSAAMCTKIPSTNERDTKNGPAWIHILDGENRERQERAQEPKKNSVDWASRQAAYRSSVTEELGEELAGILGVEALALQEIGLGWDEDRSAWTFPMHAADGSVCGITWRQRDGKKQHYGGSSVGLYRRVGAPDDGPVAIVEGASDTAAILSYGEVDVLGLPSAGAAVDSLIPYVRGRAVTVIGDNDEGAGKRSVDAVVKAILGSASSVSVVFPPPDIKDARAWRASGALWSDIAKVEKVVPPPLKTKIKPIEVVKRWGYEGKIQRMATGFPTLDRMLRGGLPFGTVTVFNGAPNASKTMLVTVLSDRLAEGGITIGMLGVDENDDGITTRLVQRRGWTREQAEEREPDDLRKMALGLTEVSERLSIYNDSWTIDRVAIDLAEDCRRNGTKGVLVIDSLQTCRCELEADMRSPREQVTARMLAGKAAAMQLGQMVIFTGEIVRSGYDERGNNVADLALGKESGSIEYQGKVVISVRGTDDENVIKLYISKNKVGFQHSNPRTEGIYLRLDKAGQGMTEVDAPADGSSKEGETVSFKKSAELAKKCASVAVALLEHPGGLGTREIRSVIRSAVDKAGQSTIDDILFRLGIVRVPMEGRRIAHFLDGSKVDAETFDAIELGRRAAVLAVRPPAAESDTKTAE